MINEAAALSLNEFCLSNSFDLLANKTSLMMMMMMMLIMMMAIHNIFMEFLYQMKVGLTPLTLY